VNGPIIALVSRSETFNSAHQLRDPRVSDDENRGRFGKCASLHRHNYALDVVVAGKIDSATETDKNWAEVGDHS
jgi:6-pyruvoyltetrahydropterin/6-carboxytetrahydropterin synthase